MNWKKSKILGIITGVTLLGASYASAQCEPPVMIDTNNYGVMFGTKGQETKKLVFSGLIQTDYNFIRVEDNMAQGSVGGDGNPVNPVLDPTDRNNFLMRRVRVGFDADLGNGWKGVVVLNFDGKREKKLYKKQSSTAIASIDNATNTVTTTANKDGIFGIYNAYVEKVYGGNSFKAGYKKVNFGKEKLTSASKLKAIERSLATEYFTEGPLVGNISGSPLGMGSRHVGLYMDGLYNGLGYGLSLVNGFQGNCLSDLKTNELGVFGNVYYTGEFNCIDIEIGLNAGYKPKGNNKTLSAVGEGSSAQTMRLQRGSIGVINPYITATWEKFSILAEVLAADVEHGAVDAKTDAKPYGFTVMPSYKVNDHLELVGRYASIDTDFRGTRICTVIPGADDTFSIRGDGVTSPFPTSPAGDIYDNASAWYAGFNYYMMHKAVKFSAGYEYFQFKDRHNSRGLTTNIAAQVTDFTGDKSRVHAARARIQLVF